MPRSRASSISVEGVREPERGGRTEPGALVHERRDRDHPAVALAADHVLVGHVGGLDEELVELGLARDLAQRAHVDLVLLHVQQEVGEPLVLGGLGVGAGDQHAPLGLVGEGGPDLLAADPPAAVVPGGPRLQRRQVGPRLGLREPLAPDLLGRQDRLQETLLLLLGPVRDHDRAAHHEAEHVRRSWSLRPRELGAEDRLLDQRGAPAPVLRRPRDARPAVGVQLALPLALELEHGLIAARRRPGVIALEPGAKLVAKRLLLRTECQVHAASKLYGGPRPGSRLESFVSRTRRASPAPLPAS
jgi:hypothetical protein